MSQRHYQRNISHSKWPENPSSATPPHSGLYPGWWIVFAAGTGQLIQGGFVSWSMGLYTATFGDDLTRCHGTGSDSAEPGGHASACVGSVGRALGVMNPLHIPITATSAPLAG